MIFNGSEKHASGMRTQLNKETWVCRERLVTATANVSPDIYHCRGFSREGDVTGEKEEPEQRKK